MTMEVGGICDADTTLDVVWKPSATKIPSFDRDIMNAEYIVPVPKKKSLFKIMNDY